MLSPSTPEAPPGAVAYDRVGSGPPLVLLHPLGADRSAWKPVLDVLAARRELIVPDLPGFGDSPPLSGGDPDPAALARAIAALLDALGVERPHVAGNSLGAWVALEYALAGRAGSVTAIAPAGLWPQPLAPKPAVARAAARAALPLLPLLFRSPVARRAALSSTIAHPERVPRGDALHLVRAYARAPGFDAVNAAMRAGRFTGLDRLRVPVTLAWAEHDRLVEPPASVPGGVRSVVLRDCGHLAMWDDPAQVAEVLLAGSSER